MNDVVIETKDNIILLGVVLDSTTVYSFYFVYSPLIGVPKLVRDSFFPG